MVCCCNSKKRLGQRVRWYLIQFVKEMVWSGPSPAWETSHRAEQAGERISGCPFLWNRQPVLSAHLVHRGVWHRGSVQYLWQTRGDAPTEVCSIGKNRNSSTRMPKELWRRKPGFAHGAARDTESQKLCCQVGRGKPEGQRLSISMLWVHWVWPPSHMTAPRREGLGPGGRRRV